MLKELKGVRIGSEKVIYNEAEEIYEQLQKEMDTTSQTTWSDLFKNRSVLKRLLIGCSLQILREATGLNMFISFANTIFTQIGMSNPLTFNAIFQGFMAFGVVVGLFLLDQKHWVCGRKNQLLAGSVLMIVFLGTAALGILLKWPMYLTMVAMIVYGFSYQIGWGSVIRIYCGEILEMAYRDKASGITTCVQYTANVLVLLISPYLAIWSIGFTLLIFSILNCVGFLFVLFFVMETKNIPLEDIPNLFDSKKNKKNKMKGVQDVNLHSPIFELDTNSIATC
eukprot:Pgem_evm1s2022